jgi:cobalt-zinc-cadmium efflux system protein
MLHGIVMGAGHGHSPPSAGGRHRSRLLVVLGITVVVLIAELVGSWLSGSLALLADAGHMLTDATGVGLAVLAVTLAARPATAERTFGYYRLEILAAAINAVLLFGIAAFILAEAWRRWMNPTEVEGGIMLVFAAVGLAANLVGLLILRPGAKESLNVKSAYLEVLGDLLGSLAVLAAAAVIAVTGWYRADPLASVLVALMILPRTWVLLREAVDVLLEGTPQGIDLEQVREHILTTPGVVDAHDLHAWTITSGMPVLSVHVAVEEAALAAGTGPILLELARCLEEHFDVEHSTIQVEPADMPHAHTLHR